LTAGSRVLKDVVVLYKEFFYKPARKGGVVDWKRKTKRYDAAEFLTKLANPTPLL